jgi:hypothetical protein
MQIELFEDKPKFVSANTLNNLDFGTPVSIYGNICIRVKPVNFLLNSTLITDVINRGDVFIVNLTKGTMYTAEGKRKYTPLISKLMVKKHIHDEDLDTLTGVLE